MIMELKLFYNESLNFNSMETIPEGIKNVLVLEEVSVREVTNGILVVINNGENVERFNDIYNAAKYLGIQVFTRKRFYASISRIVTWDDVNSPDNQMEPDPYYTPDMVGKKHSFSGVQVNTFDEAWNYMKSYSDATGYNIEMYSVDIRVIADDKARYEDEGWGDYICPRCGSDNTETYVTERKQSCINCKYEFNLSDKLAIEMEQ
jgi:hypothetical protein